MQKRHNSMNKVAAELYEFLLLRKSGSQISGLYSKFDIVVFVHYF